MNKISYSFWGNIDFPSNLEAKRARDEKAKELRKQGYDIKKWSLTNQLKKYAGIGQPDGRIGHVYYVEVRE